MKSTLGTIVLTHQVLLIGLCIPTLRALIEMSISFREKANFPMGSSSAVAWTTSFHVEVVQYEEPFLIEKYWDAYEEYMNRTPRRTGVPDSRKKD